jgi:hypothetical protein
MGKFLLSPITKLWNATPCNFSGIHIRGPETIRRRMNAALVRLCSADFLLKHEVGTKLLRLENPTYNHTWSLNWSFCWNFVVAVCDGF